VLRDLAEGWRGFRSRTWMWSVIMVWVANGILLFGPLIPLGAVLISRRLGAPAYGWVESALGAGTVLGGLGALRIKPSRPLAAGLVGAERVLGASVALSVLGCTTLLLIPAVRNLRRVAGPRPPDEVHVLTTAG
jgi:hypothetical protein